MVEATRMTAAEFARLPETTQPTELLNGELIVSPAPKDDHQRVVTLLTARLAAHLPEGELRVAPSDVHLDEANVVQPDLFWVRAGSTRCTLEADGYWHGAPDFVIEVISPRTALRDRREKFALYELHGVRLYWLVDPSAETIEAWRLTDDGAFRRAGVYGPEDEIPLFDEQTIKGWMR